MKLFKKVTDYKSDFTTYPRTFEGYKWYKPIIIAVLSVIVYMVLNTIATDIAVMIGMLPSTDLMNSLQNDALGLDTMEGIFTSVLLVLIVPAIYIPSKLLKERSFSSYLSSAGGWRWDIFFKSAAICAVVYVALNAISFLVEGATFDIKFTLLTLVLAIIVTPFQCFAEEYLFRGFFMQSLGSWFKVPAVAIIFQALIFAVIHSYNSIGLVFVLMMGLVCGLCAWHTKGLEVSSAIHSINNLVAFLTMGFGLTVATTEIQLSELLLDMAMLLISVAAIFLIDRKWNWLGLERQC